MAIAVIGMLDEREEALQLITDGIEKKGHRPLLIDISIGTGAITSSLKPSITAEEIAVAGGTTMADIQAALAKEREKASAGMAQGLGNKLLDLFQTGDLEGVIAIGGMTGTFISLTAMKRLPFGLPKLLISSVTAMPAYAKKLAEFFGVRDITVMHSVVDTVGYNPLVKSLMINGAGAICGMVEASEPPQKEKKRSVALTEFGFCDQCAQYVRERLEQSYNIISFHATGLGEKAAVDLVGQGLFEAFIDLVPSGFSEYLLGGNRAAGDDRLDAGGRQGKPYILTPCGFDMISCGPIQRRDEGDPLWTSRKLAQRKLFLQDAMRVQARTSAEEMVLVARAVADKLNNHTEKKSIKFLIPTRGFSSLSGEGGVLYDPEVDAAFLVELKNRLDPDIKIVEVDAHINTPAFAEAVVTALKDSFNDRTDAP
ncbi:MAG: Tm-1-like ATP-binding domain-containing protein [Desulfobacterales bacterium]|nr:Tm-1-like ATP-binding domain-containing protein [Desulfobacterales bacterium]